MDFDPPFFSDPELEATFGRHSTFDFKSGLPNGCRLMVTDRWAVGAKCGSRIVWLDSEGGSHRSPCIVMSDPEGEACRRIAAWERRFGVAGFIQHVEPIGVWTTWRGPQ